MALMYPRSKNRFYPKALLLTAFLLLSGCSVYDIKQLIATTPDRVLIVRQDGQHNALNAPVAKEKFTHLNGVRVDPKGLGVTPSHSLAVETQLNAPFALLSSTLSLSNISLEQAQKTLIQYLAWVEEKPERVEKLLGDAEQLAQSYPDDALLQSLLQRITRYSDWQPVNTIINSAGIDFVSVKGWQPESPFIRARRALLPPVAENEHVLFGDQRLVLLLTNLASVSLHIDARLDDVPFLPESSTKLLYQVDDGTIRQMELVDKADWLRFTLSIPAGEHSVRLYQQQPVGNQFVKLRFDDHFSNLAVAQERPYFISTAEMPLELYSQGPSVLRIDEFNESAISYRYQNVPEGWHKIRLPPPSGKKRSLLRVSQRVVNLQPKPLNNRIIRRTLRPVAESEAVLNEPVTHNKVELIDAFKLGKQEDGTISAGVDFVRRNNRQEGGSALPVEQFMQYRLNYRYFDEPHDIYWNTRGFLRIREHGGPSFGLEEFVYYKPDWLPFTLRSSAKVIAQVPDDQLEALGQWNLLLSNAYHLHPKTLLIPSLGYFARTMSLRNSARARTDPDFKLKVDQDIFTPYKADQPQGLTPALTLQHRPWLDTIWSASIASGSNEDLNFFNPDHFRTEVRWQQLLGSIELDASYRSAFYQPDVDRSTASTRSYVELELNWQHWTAHQNRIEVAALYSYDIQRYAHLATLSFTYHFGEGRGYRDFAPNEFNFRDIRQRQMANEKNNVMRDVDQPASQYPAP